MTREKKELLKQIAELDKLIDVECAMDVAGCMPSDWLDSIYEQKRPLEEKLAKLSHYPDVESYYQDDRALKALF